VFLFLAHAMADYRVWVYNWDTQKYLPVAIPFGGQEPAAVDVRSTYFEDDGRVPMVGVRMRGLNREIISHMDSTRFYHMISSKTATVKTFLSEGDLKTLRPTCFLVANHD